jgi:hypothetical protein
MIQYDILSEGKLLHRCIVDVNRSGPRSDASLPEWTQLDHNKCTNCPHQTKDLAHCPVAVDLLEVIDAFKQTRSTTRVQAIVKLDHREVHTEVDAQTAIQSLLGLVMGSSRCPILGRFHGLAHFHLPFATGEETILRGIFAHLFREFLRARAGGPNTIDTNLEGLIQFYREVQTVNRGLVDRFRSASEADASLNAVVNFFSLSVLVEISLDEYLQKFETLFI